MKLLNEHFKTELLILFAKKTNNLQIYGHNSFLLVGGEK